MIVERILTLRIHFIEYFGYWIMFLATFLECFPFVGVFVPGAFIIFIGGFIAKLGFIDVVWVFVFASSGAFLGDLCGYLLGRHFGKEFLPKYGQKLFLIKRAYTEKLVNVCRYHTGKALVFGRLSPITRSTAPFIVGSHKISATKFVFYTIIGSILWAFVFIALGWFLGQSYQVAQNFENIVLAVALLIVIVFYSVTFTKFFIERREYKKIQNVGEVVAEWKG